MPSTSDKENDLLTPNILTPSLITWPGSCFGFNFLIYVLFCKRHYGNGWKVKGERVCLSCRLQTPTPKQLGFLSYVEHKEHVRSSRGPPRFLHAQRRPHQFLQLVPHQPSVISMARSCWHGLWALNGRRNVQVLVLFMKPKKNPILL